jgi:7-keto-8-aminopelargonate synthetase-like enzyme
MSATPDESIDVAEAAAMDDSITAVRWLRSTRTYWCDTCLRPSIVKVVRRAIRIDADGAARSETSRFVCTDHGRWIA